MKKRIIILSMLSVATLTVLGCKNDFIDVPSTQAVDAADIESFNNNQGAESFVTSIYEKYLDWNISSFSWIGLTTIASDEADKGSDPGDTGTDKNILDALQATSTTPSVTEEFGAQYQAVNRANQALKFLPLLDKADPQLRARLIGEAKFMRAFTYFNLVRLFGAVPLVDHVPIAGNADDNTMLFKRVPVDQVYAFIEKDLNDAIAALPPKSQYPADQVGRASQGAAYALLAKVSLYEKKWQAVLDNCNMVTGYSLTPNFQDQYKVTGKNNQESIFEIQSIGQTVKIGIQQYSQTQAPRGAGGWGWGFATPTQELVDAFNADGDHVRRDATVMFRGSTLYDGTVLASTVTAPYYNYKAYSPAFLGDDFTDVDIRYLRFAGVLLMKAEALNELGQTPQALIPLNLVRARAGLTAITSTDQNVVRQIIWNERRLELAFEHDRWFDIIRTGQAQAAMAADGKTFTVGKNEVYPIPQDFINRSNGITTQNPGY